MIRLRLRLLLTLALLCLAACGGASAGSGGYEPFVAELPERVTGGGGTLPAFDPPTPGHAPRFESNAFVHAREAFYGSFPSDVVRFEDTLFTTDADPIESQGAWILPLDAESISPVASARYEPVFIQASDLVDSLGRTGDAAAPVGFGFFLNDLEVASSRLGFVLVNAGGSDSTPTLANLVAFDPLAGTVLQTVDLAQTVPAGGRTTSTGQALPGDAFRQAGAEALAFVPTSTTRGLLYVAMTNLVFGAPSYGAEKNPATVQVYEVDLTASRPVTSLVRTLHPEGYNPVALQVFASTGGDARILLTMAGTTGYDAASQLVPQTSAYVHVLAASTSAPLGTFELGRVGLAAARPALGRDRAGHRIGFFPSAVTGEIHLLRLDGIYDWEVDPSRVAVLRGETNGIPIAREDAGGPGGNITSLGLVADGRGLVVAGFGDLFAWPTARPGRLYVLSLPPNVVTGSGFGTNFVPGVTLLETLSGRTLGAMAVGSGAAGRPDVYVNVGGPIDLATYLGAGPGSLGALWLNGLIAD